MIVFILSLFVVPGLANLDGARLIIFLGVLALGLLATAPIGAVIGSLVKSSGAGFGLTFFPLVALVAISGIFYPISALPAWVQWIAQIFPVYWLGWGLRSVFSPATAAALEPGGTFRPLATFLVLAAWGVVGLLLAPPTLRRMARRTSGEKWKPENSALFEGSSTILSKVCHKIKPNCVLEMRGKNKCKGLELYSSYEEA